MKTTNLQVRDERTGMVISGSVVVQDGRVVYAALRASKESIRIGNIFVDTYTPATTGMAGKALPLEQDEVLPAQSERTISITEVASGTIADMLLNVNLLIEEIEKNH